MKIKSNQPVLIVGIGGAAWWVLQGFERCGLQVEGFIVTSPIYETVELSCGLPVYKSNTWQHLPHKQEEYVVVIGVMNPAINVGEMKRELELQGWSNVAFFSDYARQLYLNEGINCCMLEDLSNSYSDIELSNVRDYFSDQESKILFDAFLKYCSELKEIDDLDIEPNPYYPGSLPRWPSRLRVVDCGSFDGQVIREALNCGYQIEFGMCLEPDPANFEKLTRNIRDVGNLVCLPLAVGNEMMNIGFDSKGTTGSRINGSEIGSVIQCVTLDNLIPAGPVNLIKMDIEGFEYAALEGAQNLIVNSRPGLAISVYHLTGDIIKIPRLLKLFVGDSYNYFLRRHSRTIADTIFYAFPKEWESY